MCEGRQVVRQVVSQGKKYGCRDQEASKDVCRETGRKATGDENAKIRGLFECVRVCAAAHGLFHLFGQFYHDWLILETPHCMEKEPGYFRE